MLAGQALELDDVEPAARDDDAVRMACSATGSPLTAATT